MDWLRTAELEYPEEELDKTSEEEEPEQDNDTDIDSDIPISSYTS